MISPNIRPIENLFAAIHPKRTLLLIPCSLHFNIISIRSFFRLFNSEMCNLSMFYSCTTSQLESCMRRLFSNAMRNEMNIWSTSPHPFTHYLLFFPPIYAFSAIGSISVICYPIFLPLQFKTEQKRFYGLCNDLQFRYRQCILNTHTHIFPYSHRMQWKKETNINCLHFACLLDQHVTNCVFVSFFFIFSSFVWNISGVNEFRK